MWVNIIIVAPCPLHCWEGMEAAMSAPLVDMNHAACSLGEFPKILLSMFCCRNPLACSVAIFLVMLRSQESLFFFCFDCSRVYCSYGIFWLIRRASLLGRETLELRLIALVFLTTGLSWLDLHQIPQSLLLSSVAAVSTWQLYSLRTPVVFLVCRHVVWIFPVFFQLVRYVVWTTILFLF